VRALAFSNTTYIYVGVNDLGQSSGRTATVDVSLDGGATYKSYSIESRKTMGRMGIRPPSRSPDNTVYAAFFGWRKFNGSVATSDVVVVRDDAGAPAPKLFRL